MKIFKVINKLNHRDVMKRAFYIYIGSLVIVIS